MSNETALDSMFPSMKPNDMSATCVKDEFGAPIIPFKMDDAAIDGRRAMEAKEAKNKTTHQREMQNIREHGPLDRLSERVLSEEEMKEGADQSVTGRVVEDQELKAMIESGDVEALAGRLTDQLREIGASEQDLAMVEYFKTIASTSTDPGWKKFAMKLSAWCSQALKQKKGSDALAALRAVTGT